MYFDKAPKKRREDLYNFDQQYERLLDSLRERRAKSPLIKIIGLRRTGKTSLAQTVFNKADVLTLTLNGNAFAETSGVKKRAFFRVLKRNLSKTLSAEKGKLNKILDYLKGIEWLIVSSEPPFVQFRWERPVEEFDLLDIVMTFNEFAMEEGKRLVLFVDEAQEFRKLKGYDLTKLMAYIFDELDDTQIVVSGSQIGVLHDFLGVNDPEAPLYGRSLAEIEMPKLGSESSLSFLKKGFEQVDMNPDQEILESAVDRLGGIIGWLTFFGAESVEKGEASEEVLAETQDKGSELALIEFQNFLRVRKQARNRYRYIMREVARVQPARWSHLKARLSQREGKEITDAIISNLLNELVKNSFLEKNEEGRYIMRDPLLSYAFQEKS